MQNFEWCTILFSQKKYIMRQQVYFPCIYFLTFSISCLYSLCLVAQRILIFHTSESFTVSQVQYGIQIFNHIMFFLINLNYSQLSKDNDGHNHCPNNIVAINIWKYLAIWRNKATKVKHWMVRKKIKVSFGVSSDVFWIKCVGLIKQKPRNNAFLCNWKLTIWIRWDMLLNFYYLCAYY